MIVPIYNTQDQIGYCIDSIINQSFKNIELILVDDGSTDNSGAICQEYALRDTRIRYIKKENGGVSTARNRGVDEANGKYLAFVDSDDLLHRDALKIMFEISNSFDADIVLSEFCNFTELSEIKTDSEITSYLKKEVPAMEAWEHVFDDKHMVYGTVCGALYKTSVFENIVFPVGRVFEDTAVSYRLYVSSKKTVYIDATLYFYYTNPTSITHQFTEKTIRDSVFVSAERAVWFKQKLGDDSNIYFISMRFHLRHVMDCYRKCENRKLRKYLICSFDDIVNYRLLIKKDKSFYKECKIFRLKAIIKKLLDTN